jgi:hypothetical protein
MTMQIMVILSTPDFMYKREILINLTIETHRVAYDNDHVVEAVSEAQILGIID